MQITSWMKRRWKWCLVFCTVLALTVFHRQLLHRVAHILVVDDSITNCDTLLIVGGDRSYAIAAKLFAQDRTRQIALLQQPKRPLVESGILAPGHEIIRREIVKRGVPAESIKIVPREVRNIWEIADRVKEELKSGVSSPRRVDGTVEVIGVQSGRTPLPNPLPEGEGTIQEGESTVRRERTEKIVVMADVLQTKRLRWVMRRTLTEEEMARVQFLAVRDRRFNESNWWRNRLGIKEVVNSYVRFCHTIAVGREPPFSPPKWSAKELQRRLLSAGQTDR